MIINRHVENVPWLFIICPWETMSFFPHFCVSVHPRVSEQSWSPDLGRSHFQAVIAPWLALIKTTSVDSWRFSTGLLFFGLILSYTGWFMIMLDYEWLLLQAEWYFDIFCNIVIASRSTTSSLAFFVTALGGPQAVGPYVPDFVLPLKIAVEVDGYTHFYAFSQRLTVLCRERSDIRLGSERWRDRKN